VTHLGLVATAARITPPSEMISSLRRGEPDEIFLRGAFGPDVPDEAVRTVVDDLRRVRLAPDAPISWPSRVSICASG